MAVSLPNYTKYFFKGTNLNTTTTFSSLDEGAYNSVFVNWSVDLTTAGTNTAASYLLSYVGAGVDFNVVGFIHTPIVYIYSAMPTPN